MALRLSFKEMSLKQLFLVDSMGALLTALLTGIIMPKFEKFLGIPASLLYSLSAIALALFVYSLLCHFSAGMYIRQLMLIITLLNILYCCTTLILLAYHSSTITTWGWVYFSGEIVIILALASLEFKKASTR